MKVMLVLLLVSVFLFGCVNPFEEQEVEPLPLVAVDCPSGQVIFKWRQTGETFSQGRVMEMDNICSEKCQDINYTSGVVKIQFAGFYYNECNGSNAVNYVYNQCICKTINPVTYEVCHPDGVCVPEVRNETIDGNSIKLFGDSI